MFFLSFFLALIGLARGFQYYWSFSKGNFWFHLFSLGWLFYFITLTPLLRFILLHFLWVRNLGMAQLSPLTLGLLHKSVIKVLVDAAVVFCGRICFQAHSYDWQESVPPRLLIWGPHFLISCWLKAALFLAAWVSQ